MTNPNPARTERSRRVGDAAIIAGLRDSITELEADTFTGPLEDDRRRLLAACYAQLERRLTAAGQYVLPGMLPPTNTQLRLYEEN